MAYPPAALTAGRANDTPATDNHPGDHNAVAAAVNDIVTVLGSAPQGGAASVQDRFDGLIAGGELVMPAAGTTTMFNDTLAQATDAARIMYNLQVWHPVRVTKIRTFAMKVAGAGAPEIETLIQRGNSVDANQTTEVLDTVTTASAIGAYEVDVTTNFVLNSFSDLRAGTNDVTIIQLSAKGTGAFTIAFPYLMSISIAPV